MPQGSSITCPHCGVTNDGHFNPEDLEERPSDGAVSMCLYCGGLAIYVDNATDVRLPSEKESADLAKHPYIQKLLAARAATTGN